MAASAGNRPSACSAKRTRCWLELDEDRATIAYWALFPVAPIVPEQGTEGTMGTEKGVDSMKITSLGRTGLKVSEICLGTMTFGNQADEATSFAIMDAADAAGVTFFDTADVYPLGGGLELVGRTEEIVGKWLRERG